MCFEVCLLILLSLKGEREQFEFYGKSFSLKITTCNQMDREMDGQIATAKNSPVPPTLVSVVLKAVKANPILWLPHETSTTIYRWKRIRWFANMYRWWCHSWVTWRRSSGKLEFRERFIPRKVPDVSKGFQMKMFRFVGWARVNETFKLTEDNVREEKATQLLLIFPQIFFPQLFQASSSCGK